MIVYNLWLNKMLCSCCELTFGILYSSSFVDCSFSISRLRFSLLWITKYIFCFSFECQFICWIRLLFGTVWKNMSRLSTAIACAFSQYNVMCKTFLILFLCCFFPLPSTFVMFLEIFVFNVLCSVFLVSDSSYRWFFIMFTSNIKSLDYWLFFTEYCLASPFYKLAIFDYL